MYPSLEWMFRAAMKRGLLHDKCFDSQDRINLTDASLFMAGKPTLYSGVECEVAHFPSIISHNVKNILYITGGASHTTEVDNKDNLNLAAYWEKIDTPYLLFSITFMLCDILVWFSEYSIKNPNIETNRQLWKNIEYDGVVEQDTNNNYHVGNCLLPYINHPPVGSKIKLIKVVKNDKENNSSYPIFSKEYALLK